MTLLILIGCLLVVLAVMAGLVGWQWRRLRLGQVTVAPVSVALADLLQWKVDQWYVAFGFFFKQLAHLSYFYALLFFRRLVIIARYLLTRVERRFSRMIDSVRGKGVIHKRGTVSLFLSQIKEPK